MWYLYIYIYVIHIYIYIYLYMYVNTYTCIDELAIDVSTAFHEMRPSLQIAPHRRSASLALPQRTARWLIETMESFGMGKQEVETVAVKMAFGFSRSCDSQQKTCPFLVRSIAFHHDIYSIDMMLSYFEAKTQSFVG